ncbi:MAG: PilZ domain-containing protein [Pseudomonadota bacterium]
MNKLTEWFNGNSITADSFPGLDPRIVQLISSHEFAWLQWAEDLNLQTKPIQSMVLAIDGEKSLILCDFPLGKEMEFTAARSGNLLKIEVRRSTNSLQWQSQFVGPMVWKGEKTIALTWPQQIIAYQRRSAYRVAFKNEAILERPTLIFSTERADAIAIVDLSVNGIGFHVASQFANTLRPGVIVQHCELWCGAEPLIQCDLEIRRIETASGKAKSFVGAKINRIERNDQRKLEQFLAHHQRQLQQSRMP